MSERPRSFKATKNALHKICAITNEYQGLVFVEEERKRADALALSLSLSELEDYIWDLQYKLNEEIKKEE